MSSSLVDLMHENADDRYPIDPPSPSSGSSERDLTPPYLARSLPSRGSSTTTSTRRRHRRHDGHHRDDEDEGESSAKLLARIVSRFDQRDVKHVRTLLLITNDRLESETRRADQAEQRVVDALHRIRSANEATALAQADAVQAKQEVQLHRLQLDQAQHERTNMQEIIDRLEQSCKDAEEESARARSVARRLREELLSSKAREKGRKEGYEEGFARGRAMELVEAQDDGLGRKRSTSSRPPMRRAPPVRIEASDETTSESRSEDSLPVPVPVPSLSQQRPRRPPSAPTEAPYTSRVTPPVRRAPLPPSYPNTRPPSTRPTPPPAPTHVPVHVPDVAPIVQTLPVPTLTTPLNAPSPSHSRPSPPEHRRAQLKSPSPPRRSKTPAVASPQPLPVPMPASLRFPTPSRSPAPSRTPVRTPAPAPVPMQSSTPHPAPAPAPAPRTPDPVPIPIRNAPPSPRHPRVPLLPDGYIPYAANHDTSSIVLPPQHELSRPVSPIEFGPNGIPKPPPPDEFPDEDDSLDSLPVVPPPGARSAASFARSHGRYTPSVASREYEYGGGDAPLPMKAPSTVMTSPQSRPSTLSHYDILGPRRQEAVYRQGVDRDTIMAGQGPPDRVYSPRAQSVEEHDRDSRSAWEKIFKKSQRSKHSLKGKEREYVPDIFVESPSTPNSTSKPNTAIEPPEPHLLSPEHARTGVVLPTLTDIFAPPDSQRTGPVPIPTQSPRYIPSTSPRPIPHQSPLPVPPPLPHKMYVPYAAAPVPDGVVYPAAPGRPQSRASVETGGPLSPISLGKPFSSF